MGICESPFAHRSDQQSRAAASAVSAPASPAAIQTGSDATCPPPWARAAAVVATAPGARARVGARRRRWGGGGGGGETAARGNESRSRPRRQLPPFASAYQQRTRE